MINVSKNIDNSRVIDSIVIGFSADPVFRWIYPEPHSYLKNSPTLIDLFGGNSFENDTAFHLNNYTGAALWLPPTAHPDEEGLAQLIKTSVPEDRLEEILSMFEQMDEHHPNEPCWHLTFIAVDPVMRNNGCGTTLLDHTLKIVDDDNKLAYLESTNEANLSLYKRHGFEIVGKIQAGNSHVLYPMVREPRKTSLI
jgi:ribosomal protein S18 acetylase RimI-like enzyme